MGNRIGVLWVILLIAVAAVMTGCRSPQTRRTPSGPQPPVVTDGPSVVVTKEGPVAIATVPGPVKGGPPPHAPAHGYRRKHGQQYQYHYYPSSYVYYCPQRGLYWYMRNGQWEFGVSLPDGISVNLGEAVNIKMGVDTPYAEFEAHKAAYPAGQAKQKDKPEKGKGKGKGRTP